MEFINFELENTLQYHFFTAKNTVQYYNSYISVSYISVKL